MNLKRLWRHVVTTEAAVHRAFPGRALDAIELATHEAETRHTGEIRVVIEDALPLMAVWSDISSRLRALDLFSLTRVWDTEANNGVLVYLLFADHKVEIVADRGIAARVPQAKWDDICATMQRGFRDGNFEAGMVAGVRAIGDEMARHFPATDAGRNELSNRPAII